MDQSRWSMEPILEDMPSSARMYDYLLGGHHNFAADRAAADRLRAIYPDMVCAAQANRAFLRRAVGFIAAQGVAQFLDLGSGIPTAGNVHEVAQQINPTARVIYVDVESVVALHSAVLLRGNSRTTIIQEDACRPDVILAHPEVQRTLDFSQPVAVLMLSLLHFVADDQVAHQMIARYREALASGSYLAISHVSLAEAPDEVTAQIEKVYSATTTPFKSRTRAEFEPLLAGFDLIAPGIVYAPRWRPEGPDDVFLDQPERSAILAAVGQLNRGAT